MHFPRLLAVFLAIFFIVYNFWYLYFDSYFLFFTKLSVSGTLAIISWTLAYWLLEQFYTDIVSPNGKIVLITGCDRGFGHSLAIRLDRLGFTVYAGVLFPEGDGALSLVAQCSTKLKIIKMDVTKEEDVLQVVEEIRSQSLPLWAVVNNAGIGYNAFFDWGKDVDLYRRMFEVNVFGLIRVTKYCVPLLRQSKGRIVNMGSVLGRFSGPTLSHYCMAKHSVRAFSDALRREFLILGDQIKVTTIEPTFYKTDILDKETVRRFREQAFSESPKEIQEAYKDGISDAWIRKGMQVISRISRRNIDEVTETMEKAVTLKEPKLFYRCAGYHDVLLWALSHMPETFLDYFSFNRFSKMVLNVLEIFFKNK